MKKNNNAKDNNKRKDNVHLCFSQRVKLQYCLDNRYNCTAELLAKQLGVSRWTIYYEIKNNRSVLRTTDVVFNHGNPYHCKLLDRFPFVCNGCIKTLCSHRRYVYDAYEADAKARNTLVSSRSNTVLIRNTSKVLNSQISPLIKQGQSIHAAKIVSGCKYCESTIRNYIEKERLDVKRIDLPRAVRFRAKKEYRYTGPKLSVSVLNGRTYDDYLRFMANPSLPFMRVIQVDSVIGKRNDRQAILTIYFLNSKLQIGRLYYKKADEVVRILRNLHKKAMTHGVKLFDVVLADNGPEFHKLYQLEVDEETGEKICNVFYCDPYASYQKAECEKNHGLFRRIYPKSTSFLPLTQEVVDEIFSHINSYPRASLGNCTPYELFLKEYNLIILSILNIIKVKLSKVVLKPWSK